MTWVKQITSVRIKANGAYQSLKPFLINKSASQQTKASAFNAIVRSICTYAIPIWGADLPTQINKIQGTYMRILRGSVGSFWFVQNTQILRETGLPAIQEAAATYAANLRDKIPNHEHPFQLLALCSSKPSDRVQRPRYLIPHSYSPLHRVCACDR